jgi:hypothetical protein
MLTESRAGSIKPRRIARKVFDGAGLYLLVTPKGGRCWRYAYRFAGKHKTLSLGTLPDVPLDRARSRHEFARHLLANRIDPAGLKAALGKHIFLATLREWEKAKGRVFAISLCSHEENLTK